MVTKLNQQITEGQSEKVKTEILQKIMSDEAYIGKLEQAVKKIIGKSAYQQPEGEKLD